MQSVGRFIVQRAIRALLTLWLVVSAVFIILRLSGDPVATLLGPDARPEQIVALQHALGLDAPAPVQYVKYFANLAHGDFGNSIQQRRPALGLVLARFPATAQLALVAFAIAATIGLTLGVLTALNRGSVLDRLALAVMSAFQAAPPFFVGILLILFLSVRFGWLPSSGRGAAKQLVLPALTLSALTVASLARLTRSSLLDVLRNDFIRTARSKGLPERTVIISHALRNAALPLVTVMGLELGGLLTGAVITETVFAWPGVGRLALDAVRGRDYPVVQTAVLFIVAVFVLINFLVDCSYALLDPRVSET